MSAKIISPFMPFLAEHIYKRVSNKLESVHLEDWPKAKGGYIKPELEQNMSHARSLVALALAARKAAKIKVRQPLAGLTLKSPLDSSVAQYLVEEINVKELFVNPLQEEKASLDTHLTPALIQEGWAREIARQLQDMRKEAKYQIKTLIEGFWATKDVELASALKIHSVEIAQDVLMKEFKKGKTLNRAYDVELKFEVAPGRRVDLGIKTST